MKDAAVAQRVRLYTQRGNDAYPLSELQAVVLLPQLEQLAERNRTRAANVLRLLDLLRDITGLRCFVDTTASGGRPTREGSERANSVLSNANSDNANASGGSRPPFTGAGFYKLGFWYDSAAFAALPRDRFAGALRAEGIALDPGFRALHRSHSRSRFRAVNDLPHATRADEALLVLHHPVLLGTETDLQQVVEAIVKLQAAAID